MLFISLKVSPLLATTTACRHVYYDRVWMMWMTRVFLRDHTQRSRYLPVDFAVYKFRPNH